MRYFVAVVALGLLPLVGCSDPEPLGGTGGSVGTGGTGGMPECLSPEDCADDGNECTAALCTDGSCQTMPVEDGTACTEGECRQGDCVLVFSCDEAGIRAAIAEGGGPHFFACDGPTTVETGEAILIDNDVILDGEGDLTVDGGMGHRVFLVDAGVETELRGMTVTGGFSATENGGGIYSSGGTLTLTNSTVSGNTAEVHGGGIFNNFGTLTLTNSTVSGNTAEYGGGIFNEGTLTLMNSTVSGNTADDDGGGINNTSGELTVTNSTVSGNTATNQSGGGIANGGVGTLTSSTVAANTAGNGIVNFSGTLTLTNTLIDGDCFTISGSINSVAGNLESPLDTCGFGDPVDDLKLGDLQDNGGPTFTHALLTGSPAIDVIEQAMCGVDKDQRGLPRPAGTTDPKKCDVGAFEVQP